MSTKPDELCGVCDNRRVITWTDCHGVAACVTCNVPYRVYHYENDKRVSKPAELLVDAEWLPLVRRYWSEAKRRIPNGQNFPGSSYEQCTRGDFDAWNAWCDANADALPKRVEPADHEVAAGVPRG